VGCLVGSAPTTSTYTQALAILRVLGGARNPGAALPFGDNNHVRPKIYPLPVVSDILDRAHNRLS
jgi:hypothetical protein